MAEVFRARAIRAHGVEKIVAIKRILPSFRETPYFESRFIAEARVAISLGHANIVQVFDFGRLGRSLYLAMELVDGPDLRTLIEAARRGPGGTLPIAVVLQIGMGLAKGLDH